MALVIFCVALVAAMRTRMSLRLGIGRRTTEDRGRIRRPTAVLHLSSVLCRLISRECLGIALDCPFELGGGRVRQIAGFSDIIEDLGMLGAYERQQALLESAHPRDR